MNERIAASSTSTPSASTVIKPPALITHFPIRSPTAAIVAIPPTRTTEASRIIGLLAAIHSALGPMAKAMYVISTNPYSPTSSMM
jgi:hypothetical protein